MWRDFAQAAVAIADTRAPFAFPEPIMPSWTESWRRIVSHVRVAPDDATKEVLLDSFAGAQGVRTLGFVNAHALNTCVRDARFAADLLALDVLVRDGIGVQALYRLAGDHAGLNLNGTDLVPELLAHFAGKRIALFGTRPDVVQRAATRLRDELGCMTLVADGFQHDGHYLELVVREKPDLVVLGMGMPKQERVARLMRHGLRQDVAVVCGGAILDFLAGQVSRAPLWMRRAGLEWAHRLTLEPRRLFGRYVIGNPLFLARTALLTLLGRRAPTPPVELAQAPPPRPALPAPRPPRPELRLVADNPPAASPAPIAVAPRFVPPLAPVDRGAASSFSANRPVIGRDDLYGRERDLARLTKWVLDQSGNALIYGPRGYGKTSLARVFGEIADSLGHVVLYAAASRQVDFTTLIRTFLSEVPPPGIAVPDGPLGVQQVASLLAGTPEHSLVLILDEYDRLEDETARAALIELIKDTSDLTANVRFVLCGVATDAAAILGYHPSVHRCISAVPLGRLDIVATDRLFRQKAAADGLRLDDGVAEAAVRLAAGSAYHIQLIGQKLVSQARLATATRVTAGSLDAAIDEIVGDAMRIDPVMAGLARLFAGDPAQRGAIRAVAEAALAETDDSVPAMTGAHATTPRDVVCAWLAAQGVLVEASREADGVTVRYRFANAFTPQLLLMMNHLLDARARATG